GCRPAFGHQRANSRKHMGAVELLNARAVASPAVVRRIIQMHFLPVFIHHEAKKGGARRLRREVLDPAVAEQSLASLACLNGEAFEEELRALRIEQLECVHLPQVYLLPGA